MKDFKYFCGVFSRALRKVLKNTGYVIIACLTGITLLLSFAGTGLCLYHIFTGAPLASNWLYASPVVFILTLTLFYTYLDW